MRSEICLYELGTHRILPVLGSDRIVEAPNFTPDGKALIVNSDGKIYRIPLASPEMIRIDTGFAVTCNNDHGVSPDGETLVISDRTRTAGPCIYTLPLSGGSPKRVTDALPSYFHGWSPDGETITYTAKRDGHFHVYTIAATGGAEFAVVAQFDHCDGPDYSADGQWIWFNGESDGAVDIWRVRPNGRDLERMTNDTSINWFPHPSPDGKNVLYMAYAPDVIGHPRDQDVALRLMPTNGGQPETLCEIFGGQGTLNVPCWAPDSQRFAFVRFYPE